MYELQMGYFKMNRSTSTESVLIIMVNNTYLSVYRVDSIEDIDKGYPFASISPGLSVLYQKDLIPYQPCIY